MVVLILLVEGCPVLPDRYQQSRRSKNYMHAEQFDISSTTKYVTNHLQSGRAVIVLMACILEAL